MNLKLLKAIAFATVAHQKQVRKYTGLPYLVHPLNVLEIMIRDVDPSKYGISDKVFLDMQVACLMHDTIEDTTTTYDDLLCQFGDSVANLVEGLTNTSKQHKELDRAGRKQMDAENLRDKTMEVHIIKYADIMSNTSRILEDDPAFAPKYIKENIELVPYLNNLPQELNKDLLSHLHNLLKVNNDSSNQ